MVSYILDEPLGSTENLSGFLHDLTEGNPLFISESLSYLYTENLIFFNSDLQQWNWNLDKIKDSTMPITVADLFGAKIQKLPSATIELLEFCACLGNLFTTNELSVIKEISLSDIYNILQPVLEQGLLIENKDQLQFVHDRVQEATLSRISRERRKKIHWQIGQHLYAEIAANTNLEKQDNICTIVSHLNISYKISKEFQERFTEEEYYLLAKLNFSAGNYALRSLATVSANEYFKTCIELLPSNSWFTHY